MAKDLKLQEFQITENLCVVDYRKLLTGTDCLTGVSPVKLFNGTHILNIHPRVADLCFFLQLPRHYGEIASEYQRIIESAAGEEEGFARLDTDVLLQVLLRKRFARTAGISRETRKLSVFCPSTWEECCFVTPDMMTFIDEGETWKRGRFIVCNPRASMIHYMDAPEFALAKFVQRSPKTFAELQDYHKDLYAKLAPEDGSSSNLEQGLLIPLLLERVLVAQPQDAASVDNFSRIRMHEGRPNLFVNQPAIPHQGIPARGFPISIALLPTIRCNNYCLHCSAYANDRRGQKDVLSFRVICRLLDEMHQMGLQTLRFTGGEPLMRADIFDILDYAAEKYFGIFLFTNANLVTEANIKRLDAVQEKKGDAFVVHVSLDGDQESHDAFRRTPGAFKRLTHAMHLFQKHGVSFFVEMVCHSLSLEGDRLERAILQAHDLGARSVIIHPALMIGRGQQHGAEVGLTLEQVKSVAQRVGRLNKEHQGLGLSFLSFEFASASFMDHAKDEPKQTPCDGEESGETCIRTKVSDLRPRFGQCTAGKEQLCIDHNGDVFPCPNWTTVNGYGPMGNVLENSIVEIWRDPDKWALSRGAWSFKDVAVCKHCRHLQSCEMGKLCRIPSIEWYGTPYGPPPSCLDNYRELGVPEADARAFLEEVGAVRLMNGSQPR